MSLRSLTALAVERDIREPKKPVASARRAAQDELPAEQMAFTDVLISAIPTEVLAPYTVVIGVIVGTIDQGESERLPLRWVLYASGLIAIVVWLGANYLRQRSSKKKRRFPLPETVAALLAFGAWGLVMPGSPLSASLSGDDLTISNILIAAGAAFLVGVLVPTLKKPTTRAK